DLASLRLLRRLLGSEVDLRVDANCAYPSVDDALHAIAAMRRHGISAVEEPLPPHDLGSLARITADTPETIIVDESLRTPADAAARVAGPGLGVHVIESVLERYGLESRSFVAGAERVA